QTSEFKAILESDTPLIIQNFYDLKSLAQRVRIEGAFLTEDDFFKIYQSLQAVFSVISYFSERESLYPNMEALFEHLPMEKSILTSIEKVIDAKGKIRHNASPELLEISNSIFKAESEARKKIDQIYKSAQGNGWTADGSLTVRDGRLCIPLLADHKRKLRGFIHDESSS